MAPEQVQSLNIGQWNTRSVSANFSFLKYWLQVNQFTIVCLQETWLAPLDPLTLIGYTLYRADRTRRGGGVLIAVKSNIQSVRLPTPSLPNEVELVKVQVHYPGFTFIISSVYCSCPPTSNQVVHTILTSDKTPAIILGDFNAHHPTWDQMTTNRAGHLIADFCASNSYHILNTGETTRLGSSKTSAPDLSIISAHWLKHTTWHTGPELGSDHLPLHIYIQHHTPKIPLLPTFQFTRANWTKYLAILNTVTWPHHLSYTEKVAFITTVTIHAATTSIPHTKMHTPFCGIPWWTPACTTTRQKRDYCRRIFSRTPSLSTLLELKKTQAIFRKTINAARRNHWQSFCQSLRPGDVPRRVWLHSRRMTGKYRPRISFPVLQSTATISPAPANTCQAFSQYYTRKFAATTPYPPHITPHETIRTLESPFSLSELQYSIARGRNTSPGVDNISYPLLQHYPTPALLFLLDIYNHGWDLGEIPASWKTGIMVPIQKVGKPPNAPENYRPITLLPVYGKVWERMIYLRLQWWLLKTAWWSPSHSGGIPGRSTDKALAQLTGFITTARTNSQYAAVFLADIAGAFDTLPHQIICDQLTSAKLPHKMATWLSNFLTNRTAMVRVGGVTGSPFPIQKGVPQGAVLSPLLYIAGTNSFHQAVPAHLHLQFIDDLGLGTTGTTYQAALLNLRTLIPPFFRWLQHVDLQLNPEKCQFTIFSINRRPKRNLLLHTSTLRLTSSPTLRYLGVALDQNSTWTTHLNNLKIQVSKHLSLLRTLAQHNWGAHPSALRLLTTSLLLPKLRYGAPYYRLAASSTISKLERAYNQCLRTISGVPLSTNLRALHAELNLLPFDLLLEQTAAQTAYRIRMQTLSVARYNPRETLPCALLLDLPLYQVLQVCPDPHSTSGISILPPIIADPPIWSLSPLILTTNLPFHKYDHSGHNQLVLTNWMSTHSVETCIFTDASLDAQGTVVAGYWHPQSQSLNSCQLPSGIPIFHAELFAIYMSLLWALTQPAMGHLCIATDSLSSLEHLNNISRYNDILSTLRSTVYQLTHSLSLQDTLVSFLWLPSHSGLTHNDYIDHYVSRIRPHPWLSLPLPISYILIRVKHLYLQHWQRQWHHEDTFFSTIYQTLGTPIFRFEDNRRSNILFTLARVNRLRVQTLRARWNPTLDPTCRYCHSAPASLSHVLLDCFISAPTINSYLPSSTSLTQAHKLAICLGVSPRRTWLSDDAYAHIAHLLASVHNADDNT